MDRNKSFLVPLWTCLLTALEKFSLFYIIRRFLFPKYTKGNYFFVDSWLVGHTILALLFVIFSGLDSISNTVKYALLIYGCLRVFEIFIYQLNVILIHPYNNADYSLHSYRRMTIALIHNFFEIVFWFAGTYVTLHFLTNVDATTAVYRSFTHMVTYTMDIDEKKWSVLAVFILQFQGLIGVFMTILSLARFISLLPQPRSQAEIEQEANDQKYAKILKELDELQRRMQTTNQT